jgi:hypothetical protein
MSMLLILITLIQLIEPEVQGTGKVLKAQCHLMRHRVMHVVIGSKVQRVARSKEVWVALASSISSSGYLASEMSLPSSNVDGRSSFETSMCI